MARPVCINQPPAGRVPNKAINQGLADASTSKLFTAMYDFFSLSLSASLSGHPVLARLRSELSNCGQTINQPASREVQNIFPSIRSQLLKLELRVWAYRVQIGSLQRLCCSYTHDALPVCDRLTKSCRYT